MDTEETKIASTINDSFPPTEDNPLGGLHVLPDETTEDIQEFGLFADALKLKESLLKARTPEEYGFVFRSFEMKHLSKLLNYINSPIIDFMYIHENSRNVKELVIIAAKQGNLPMIKYLLDKNTFIDFYARAAFYEACENGHLDITRYLVEKCPSIEKEFIRAVRGASRNGHLAIVKYLVDQGACVKDDFDRVFIDVAEKGHLEMIKYLVEQGVYTSDTYNRAVRIAADNGHLPVVKYLVSLGADVKSDGNKAIIYACAGGHLDVVKYLVELDSSIKTDLITGLNAHRPMVDYDSDEDIDFDAPINILGQTAGNGHLSVVKYLIELGVDARANDDEAMNQAIKNDRHEVAIYLAGLYPDIIMKTIIRESCKSNSVSVVKCMVNLGISIKHENASRWKPERDYTEAYDKVLRYLKKKENEEVYKAGLNISKADESEDDE